MSRWRHESFDVVVADESGGNVKTPQSEFLPAGRYAIVDQGKELIAGYTNDESRLCRASLPLIVFGDHTRCFKYVDFPFCMGADGIKILRPKTDADVKYLYHYLRQLRLTEGGYDRHFKYLRRSSIAVPPLPEQRRIAEVLDRAEALRANRRAALAQLDTLIQAVFLDTFGDPATNPKRFPIRTLVEFYASRRDGTKCGPFGSALKKSELVASGIPVWNMDNIDLAGRMALPFRMWITENKYRQLETYAVTDGDVIISRAGTVGKMCVANSGHAESIISTNLIRVRFGRDLLPIYFVSLMTYCKGRIGRLKTGPDGAFTHMSTGIIDKLKFPYPPLKLQQRFAAIVESVEQQRSSQRAHLVELDALFASLQHRAFRGEL